ncbi:hypothetical protein, partial [uncultured Brevundimonas sp.]|uniref:hypothetical protein n=1 Tax=uncultured Brevundimonas sp. TaxID=213418 RepID=UPI0026280F85
MKKSIVLAGAAAAAMVLASSANAQNMLNRGQYVNYYSGAVVGTYNPNFKTIAQGGQLTQAENVNYLTVNGQSTWINEATVSGDNGTAEGSDHAQFTLKGKVNTDCALYS